MQRMLSMMAIATLTLLGFMSTALQAEDSKINVSIGNSNVLVLSSDKGEKIEELSLGTIAKSLSYGGKNFNVSFDRDLNDQLSVIISPSIEKPDGITFKVHDKEVSTDGVAVVTLTFSSDLKSTIIDSGYIGQVKVNGQPTQKLIVAGNKTANRMEENRSASITDADKDAKKTPAKQEKPVAEKPAATKKTEKTVKTEKPVATEKADKKKVDALAKRSEESTSKLDNESIKEVLLQWEREVSSKSFAAASNDKVGDVRLVEVVGDVRVTDPTKGLNNVKATEGMIISQTAQISTQQNSTVAAVIGGLHTARLVSNTEAGFEQKMEGQTCDTNVKLKKGTVFARVKHRPNQTENFKISTAVGVAAAKGSTAMVNFNGTVMTVATAESQWLGNNAQGSPAFSITPKVENGKVVLAVASIPVMAPNDLTRAVRELLQISVELNQLIQQFADANGVVPQVILYDQSGNQDNPNGRSNPQGRNNDPNEIPIEVDPKAPFPVTPVN